MDDDLYFMKYLSTNFNKIKNEFKNKIERIGLAFNEDVFSDTIIKCNEKLSKTKPTQKEMLSYFWVAFKMNTLRDLTYARNNTTDLIPEISSEEFEYINDTFDAVTSAISNKFGEEMYELFVLHSNGITYSDLEKMSNKKNLKYSFRKIREYVRKYF